MSIRPELPYVGGPTERLAQKAADQGRALNRSRVAKPGRELKGYVDVTFGGSSSTSASLVAITSPSGHVAGVASAGTVAVGGVQQPVICAVVDSGGGAIVIQCQTWNGGVPTVGAVVRVFYIIWPY